MKNKALLSNMKILRFNSLIIFLSILFCYSSNPAFAQDNDPVNSRMSLKYFKKSGERTVTATVKAKDGRRYITLPGIPVEFNIVVDTGYINIGSGFTDSKGECNQMISEDLYESNNLDGQISFQSTFSGSDEYNSSEAEVSIKDIKLNLTFTKVGDEKQISLTAFNNDDSPLTDELEIKFYSPRTFTLFPLGTQSLVDANAIIPFPTDLPGDTLGNLVIIAKIEDSEEYGNVEISSTINWGFPQAKIIIANRGLGDTDAPLWMVYTLIVLLSLVWFHYMYVIYSIYLIKKESKRAIAEDMNK